MYRDIDTFQASDLGSSVIIVGKNQRIAGEFTLNFNQQVWNYEEFIGDKWVVIMKAEITRVNQGTYNFSLYSTDIAGNDNQQFSQNFTNISYTPPLAYTELTPDVTESGQGQAIDCNMAKYDWINCINTKIKKMVEPAYDVLVNSSLILFDLPQISSIDVPMVKLVLDAKNALSPEIINIKNALELERDVSDYAEVLVSSTDPRLLNKGDIYVMPSPYDTWVRSMYEQVLVVRAYRESKGKPDFSAHFQGVVDYLYQKFHQVTDRSLVVSNFKDYRDNIDQDVLTYNVYNQAIDNYNASQTCTRLYCPIKPGDTSSSGTSTTSSDSSEYFTSFQLVCSSGVTNTIPIYYKSTACLDAKKNLATVYGCNLVDQMNSARDQCVSSCGGVTCEEF